jgi:5'-nucleotidase
MRILVSNDDGIFSPGIKALGLAMRALGEVYVVAPDVEQSAVGHGITVRRPLRFKHTAAAGFGEIPAYRVDGTPADCVVLGVHLLGRPDLLVSGINIGVNLGLDLTHSGTVAAALEGTSLGIPSIAFSLDTSGEELNFAQAAEWAVRIARRVAERGLPKGVLLNVNFPPSPKGMLWTRQSVRRYTGRVILGADPMGREHFWFAAEPDHAPEEGTDRWAVNQGFIALTPLRLDLTDEERLSRAFQLAALAD